MKEMCFGVKVGLQSVIQSLDFTVEGLGCSGFEAFGLWDLEFRA